MGYITRRDINNMINESIERKMNEMRWELDNRTGMMKPAEKRPEDKINLMNQQPFKSCNIVLLNNRVNLGSTGNLRDAITVWYDARTHKIYDKKGGEELCPFREATLESGKRPGGWMYKEDYPYRTR